MGKARGTLRIIGVIGLFFTLKRFKRGGQGMNRICKIIWSLVQNGYVVVFELAKGRGKVAAQKLVCILTAAVLGMILGGAALPAYVATPTMLVTSDLTHPIAGPCFLLSPDGQPVQITGDGNAEKAPTVVIMGSLNGVKLRGNPFDGAEVPLWGRSTIQKTPI